MCRSLIGASDKHIRFSLSPSEMNRSRHTRRRPRRSLRLPRETNIHICLKCIVLIDVPISGIPRAAVPPIIPSLWVFLITTGPAHIPSQLGTDRLMSESSRLD